MTPQPLPSLPPAAPRVWTLGLAFALLVFLMVAGSSLVFGVWVGVELVLQDPQRHEVSALTQSLMQELGLRPSVMIVSILLNVALMAGFALAGAGLSPLPWRERLGLHRPSRLSVGALALAFLAALLLGQASTDLAQLAGLWRADGPLARFGMVCRAASPLQFALLMLAGSLGAGVVEELFFRGYLQTRLVARWGRWRGIALASLAFGLVHMDPVHSTFAFLLGLLLGWVAERAGSVRPTLLLHIANNLLAFAWARWLPSTEGMAPQALAVSVALCVPAFLLCVLALRRSLREPATPAPLAAPAL